MIDTCSLQFSPNQLPGNQQGFGLIEILVAVLVLAIGLLGMASLQSNGIQMTTGALSRTQAVLLTEDIIERARANRGELTSYAVPAVTPPACDLTYTVSNTVVATDDVAEWINSVSCLLPGGNATVVINGAVMTVTVSWQARSSQGNDGSVQVEAEI